MKITSLCSVVPILLFGTLVSVHALKCHEGFNMSIGGIPIEYWKQRTCPKNNKCIGQQMRFDMDLNGDVVTTAVRYGACVADVYANYLDCENLFDKDSTFDPANLLNLVPETGKSINFMANSFAQSITAKLSDEKGIKTLIADTFTFCENLGFNFEEVRPLEPSLVKVLSAYIAMTNKGPVNTANKINFHIAIAEFFNAVDNLDTDNAEFRSAIRSLLRNVGVKLAPIDANPATRAMIDKFPGLVRSILPHSWKPELWYDVGFKLAGNVDLLNWPKTLKGMVSTIKTSYKFSENIKAYLFPILDKIPDLVRDLQVNPNYITKWSLELLKYFSSTDEVTIEFSTAVIKFIEKSTSVPARAEIKTTIEWLPGLLYRFFPDDKSTTQEAYRKMTKVVNSFNFTSSHMTAAETKLSMVIKNLITITLGGHGHFRSKPNYNSVVDNFSKMFYSLISATTDYITYVDTFATVVDKELRKGPGINSGDMIAKLVTQMGGTVPSGVKPLIDGLQPVILSLLNSPFNGKKLIDSLYQITNAYQIAFPESPFPELSRRYIDLIYRAITNPDLGDRAALRLEMQHLRIDWEFAVARSLPYISDDLLEFIEMYWPSALEIEERSNDDLYIDLLHNRVMELLNPEDIKQLLTDIVTWPLTPPPHTTDGFVKAVQPTVKKITKSIKSLLGEIRQVYAPDSCRFGFCDTDLCNSHSFITARPNFRKSAFRDTARASTAAADKTEVSPTTTNAIKTEL